MIIPPSNRCQFPFYPLLCERIILSVLLRVSSVRIRSFFIPTSLLEQSSGRPINHLDDRFTIFWNRIPLAQTGKGLLQGKKNNIITTNKMTRFFTLAGLALASFVGIAMAQEEITITIVSVNEGGSSATTEYGASTSTGVTHQVRCSRMFGYPHLIFPGHCWWSCRSRLYSRHYQRCCWRFGSIQFHVGKPYRHSILFCYSLYQDDRRSRLWIHA